MHSQAKECKLRSLAEYQPPPRTTIPQLLYRNFLCGSFCERDNGIEFVVSTKQHAPARRPGESNAASCAFVAAAGATVSCAPRRRPPVSPEAWWTALLLATGSHPEPGGSPFGLYRVLASAAAEPARS